MTGRAEMNNIVLSSSLVSLFKGLAERITSAPQPNWPLPIFEAESYLYSHFIRQLLVILDALLEQGTSWHKIAALFRTPSRVVELCYLLLGIRFSGLGDVERMRLANHLVQALHCLRPYDTFCEQHTNRLLGEDDVHSLVLGQVVFTTSRERRALSRLSAMLFSMSEFVHIGIPQYGREIHGPYNIDSEHFVIVRSHFDLRLVELWPFLKSFPFDEVEIIETYRGRPDLVRFDLTNHMTSLIPLHNHLEKAAVHAKSSAGVELVSNWERLLEVILSTADECFRFSESFKRNDWLRKHLEARHLYLKSHANLASLPWEPTPQEYAHLEDSPLYFELQDLLSSSFDNVFSQMCSDFNIVTNKVNGLH
jgi:hypothetical protein